MERKLAAILAADMVGYSRLMAEDEAGTLDRLRALRANLIDPQIAEQNGRIVKVMGDGMLVVFDSVVGAVECAAAVQRAMAAGEAEVPAKRRIAFRIGIHLGDIMLEEGDVYGDGVNLAARLEGLAEPGGICLSEDAYRQVKGKVSLAYEDIGDQKLKNLPDAVRAYSVNLDPARLSPEAFESLTGLRLELPDQPSIAVLPFENMSGDPEQEFFADGITEDIITVLSRVSDMVVMARNSTFVYKGQAVSVPQVGREQGVRYVLEGSVRKAGKRARITAQLIDAQSGDHVWAERYDRELDDIFAVQDDITRQIVVALSVELGSGEEARVWSGKASSFEIWEYVSRSLIAAYKFTAESNREAQELARKAIALDSQTSAASVALGWALLVSARYGFAANPTAAIAEAKELALQQLAANRENADAHALMGHIQCTLGYFDEGIAAGKRAIELAPGVATNHAALALILHTAGHPEESLTRIRKAIRLSPYFPEWFLIPLGEGYRGTGELEKAREVFQHLASRAPNSPLAIARLVSIYSDLGEMDKARSAADSLLSHYPAFSVAAFLKGQPLRDPAQAKRYADSLLKAGLPA